METPKEACSFARRPVLWLRKRPLIYSWTPSNPGYTPALPFEDCTHLKCYLLICSVLCRAAFTPTASGSRGRVDPTYPASPCGCWGSPPARRVIAPSGDAAMQMSSEAWLLKQDVCLIREPGGLFQLLLSQGPIWRRCSCQSSLWHRWMHFPYQAALKPQTLLGGTCHCNN